MLRGGKRKARLSLALTSRFLWKQLPAKLFSRGNEATRWPPAALQPPADLLHRSRIAPRIAPPHPYRAVPAPCPLPGSCTSSPLRHGSAANSVVLPQPGLPLCTGQTSPQQRTPGPRIPTPKISSWSSSSLLLWVNSGGLTDVSPADRISTLGSTYGLQLAPGWHSYYLCSLLSWTANINFYNCDAGCRSFTEKAVGRHPCLMRWEFVFANCLSCAGRTGSSEDLIVQVFFPDFKPHLQQSSAESRCTEKLAWVFVKLLSQGPVFFYYRAVFRHSCI